MLSLTKEVPPTAEAPAVPQEGVWRYLSRSAASRFGVLPLRCEGDCLWVGTTEPYALSLREALRVFTGLEVALVECSAQEIEPWLEAPKDEVTDTATNPTRNFSSSLSSSRRSPAMRLVDDLFQDAVTSGASDIHLEPHTTGLRVRLRVDGILQVRPEIPGHHKAEVLSRIKVMAKLDIAERRRPQDGRIRLDQGGMKLDMRVSTLPTEHGEKIVLRLLDRSQVDLDLQQLGFSDHQLETFKQQLALSNGMILLTGPTGSGKTTTLYSALRHRRAPSVNICTVEDPIEYKLEGITQTAVKADIGLTFAQCLRSLLRQDPNILMVGEIRDLETAEIAVRAALTGHLLMSTLHANDSLSTLTRLVDMGIESFLLGSSLRLVIAQRLVRKLCPHCQGPDNAAPSLLRAVGVELDPALFRIGKGCSRCHGTGYRGRLGIFEFFVVDEEVRSWISNGIDADALRAHGRTRGFSTLQREGIIKASQGLTSLEEVLRETAT